MPSILLRGSISRGLGTVAEYLLRHVSLPFVPAGSLTAIINVVGVAALLGVSSETVVSLVPKSVTVAVAMGIAENCAACHP